MFPHLGTPGFLSLWRSFYRGSIPYTGIHIPTDMHPPTWETRIPSDMCSPGWETHIPSEMCSPTWETHIPSEMCSPTWEHLVFSVCGVVSIGVA